jgi:CheY-like chemotaxis protein
MKKLSVLIIDDEQDIRDVCKLHLEELDMFDHFIMAKDGVDAATKLNNQKFDLIILDLNLPKKNGLSLIEQISDLTHHNDMTSIILISGDVGKEILAQAIKLGLKHVILKPFDKDILQQKVQQVMKAR